MTTKPDRRPRGRPQIGAQPQRTRSIMLDDERAGWVANSAAGNLSEGIRDLIDSARKVARSDAASPHR